MESKTTKSFPESSQSTSRRNHLTDIENKLTQPRRNSQGTNRAVTKGEKSKHTTTNQASNETRKENETPERNEEEESACVDKTVSVCYENNNPELGLPIEVKIQCIQHEEAQNSARMTLSMVSVENLNLLVHLARTVFSLLEIERNIDDII